MSIKKSLFLAVALFQFSTSSALAADSYPIISESVCEKGATDGGFDGDCQYILVDFSSLGMGESDGCTGGKAFKGYCGETGGDWSDLDWACCAPAGSTASGPLVGEAMYRDNICTLPKTSGGSYGGTCKASCDSSTEKYAGACGEADEPCCVANDTAVASETGSISSGLSNVGEISVDTNYVPLENVPFIRGTNISEYLSGVYILGLVLVVIGAVFMLVIGGFQYLTSAGNTSALSSAKHTIEGALFGLFLALVAYLILYVINPDLVNLKISSFQPLALQAGPGGGGASGGAGATGGGATGSTRPCAGGLIAIPSTLGQRLTGSSTNQICKDIADRLVQLKQRTGVNIYVTSSIRSGGALSRCHKSGNADSGNCADIGINTSLPLHDPRWDALCTAVGSTPGLQLVNEASNSAACTRVSPFRQYSTSSGAHFHVKFIGP